MTEKQYNKLPEWQKEGMFPCICGGNTVLFYDENENYRVECCNCTKITLFKAKSMVQAKEHWKKSQHCAGLGLRDMRIRFNSDFPIGGKKNEM